MPDEPATLPPPAPGVGAPPVDSTPPADAPAGDKPAATPPAASDTVDVDAIKEDAARGALRALAKELDFSSVKKMRAAFTEKKKTAGEKPTKEPATPPADSAALTKAEAALASATGTSEHQAALIASVMEEKITGDVELAGVVRKAVDGFDEMEPGEQLVEWRRVQSIYADAKGVTPEGEKPRGTGALPGAHKPSGSAKPTEALVTIGRKLQLAAVTGKPGARKPWDIWRAANPNVRLS